VGPLGGMLAAALLGGERVRAGAAGQFPSPADGGGLDPAVLRGLLVSLRSGLGVVFWAIAGIAAAAAATSLLFPHLRIVRGTEAPAHVGEPAGMSAVPPDA